MPSDRTWIHRPLTNVADVAPDPGFPLVRRATFPRTVAALHVSGGVLISRDDGVGLYSDDLSEQFWNHPLTNRAELVRWNDTVLFGPAGGEVLELGLGAGRVLRRAACAVDGGWVRATDGRRAVVAGPNEVVCIDLEDGTQLWRHEWPLPYIAYAEGHLYVRRGLSDDLACVDMGSGTCRWVFRADAADAADDQSHVIGDFGVLPDYVAVVTRDGRIFKVDVTSGQVMAAARPQPGGVPLVTRDSVFFTRWNGFTEYDHRRLEETSRAEYAAELRGAWKKSMPVAVHAVCVTTESLIWTTMAGVMFGVERRPAAGSRRCWAHELKGALMPTYQPPFVGGRYLYYEPKGVSEGLVCYAAAT
jgi:outer membrane protein assembly factor BamB